MNTTQSPSEKQAEPRVSLGLATDFQIPAAADWKREAQALLKDSPFEKKMFTQTYEGLTIKAIYTAEDLQPAPERCDEPGCFPFLRGTSIGDGNLAPKIGLETLPTAPENANAVLRDGIARGENAVNVDFGQESGEHFPAAGATRASIQQLLDGIDFSSCPVYFQTGDQAVGIAAVFAAAAAEQGFTPANLKGAVEADPITDLAKSGKLVGGWNARFDAMAELVRWAGHHRADEFRTVAVRADKWHEGGAQAVQELAFAIATGVEYLRELSRRDIPIQMAAKACRFTFGIGPQFFMEVAKLRAARLLWAKVLQSCGCAKEHADMVIHARTARWNISTLDPHTNILRSTTEAFSAIAGGCNSLDVGPFDQPGRAANEFSRRIARNIPIILTEECRLRNCVDPAGGAWYVEALTLQLASKAWEAFQEIERQGGMKKAVIDGYPQREVQATAKKRVENADRRKDSYVGVNVYPNLGEQPLAALATGGVPPSGDIHCPLPQDADAASARLAEIGDTSGLQRMETAVMAAKAGAAAGEISRAFYGDSKESQEVKRLEPIRISAGFEALRRAADQYAERSGRRPTAFLANVGPDAQYRARTEFVVAFLQTGGFSVTNPAGFKTAEDAVAAIEEGALVTVICSTDDNYPQIVGPLARAVHGKFPEMLVLLAGYPEEQVETHRASGIDDFIHIRANCRVLLESIMKRTGVLA